MTSTHHMADNDLDNATPQQISQIGVNTIAINNNANSIATANTNIASNTANITAANSAIVSNDNDITTLSNSISALTTTNTTQTNSINAINNSITTLNTTTTNNTNNIASNDNDITTLSNSIASNQTNIGNNAAVININSINSATNTSNIVANTTARTTNTTNIATNTSNIATNTSAIATNLATNNTQNTNISTNTSNIATNTSAIATATTELANVVLTATQMTNSKILLGNGVGFNNGCGIQNANLNGGVLDNAFVAILQNNNGDTFIGAKDGRYIHLRIDATAQMKVFKGLIDCRDMGDGDMTFMVRSEAPYVSRLSVGGSDTDGNGDAQGTAELLIGQGVNADGTITYGGGLIYNGDDTPNIPQTIDNVELVAYNNGTAETIMGYKYDETTLKMYRPLKNVNYNEEFYGDYAEPKLIGMTAVSASTLQAHRFCYNGSTATDNTWYMPHPDFKCVCRTPPSITKAEYVVSFTTDGYFSGRNVYVCLSSSNSANNIIPSTITFIHSRNSEWTSRIHRVSVFDTTLNANATNVRYVFVKEVNMSSSGAVISSGGNQGFIVFGGRDAHAGTTATQTTHYYDNDLTPTTPTDQCQALLVKCYSIPSNVATSASATAPFQLIGF